MTNEVQRDVAEVRIFSVRLDGDDIVVDVYGGPELACGTVVVHCADERERRDAVHTLETWRSEQLPLRYSSRDGRVSLRPER